MQKLIAVVLAGGAMLGHTNAAQAQDWQGPYISGFVGYGYQPKNDNETIVFDTNLDGTFGDSVNTYKQR